MKRLCPKCGQQLVAGYPHARPYKAQDGRDLVLVVWRHRSFVTCCEATRPKDCTATLTAAEAEIPENRVRRAP